jgi:hypothetical protein
MGMDTIEREITKNGIPEKLIEMDEQVSYTKQMDENAGPVILVNKFYVDPEEVDKFLEAFAATI